MSGTARKPVPEARQRGDRKYAVIAQRQDGRGRIFNTYATEREAEAVAARLRSVGCQARVEVE